MNEILKKLGGWPLLEPNWDPTTFTWIESVYRFRKLGYSVSFLMLKLVLAFKGGSQDYYFLWGYNLPFVLSRMTTSSTSPLQLMLRTQLIG